MSLRTFCHATLCCTLLALSACARMEHAPASMDASTDASDSFEEKDATTEMAPAAEAEVTEADAESQVVTTAPEPAQLTSSAATYSDPQRKFIRTAQARFRVKDVYKSALTIEDVAAAHGGFVVRNDISSQNFRVRRFAKGNGKRIELAEYVLQGELTIRVPSDKTQDFLRSIITQMEFLDQRSFAAEDAQFELLRQQLDFRRNQEAQQELGQATQEGGKLAHKAEAITARNQARSSRDEALIAQKKFEDRVAFSTIRLSLYQIPQVRQTELNDIDNIFKKNGPGFFSRLGDSLGSGWHGLLEVLLVLSMLWPLWLLLAIPAVFLLRYLRKRRNRAK